MRKFIIFMIILAIFVSGMGGILVANAEVDTSLKSESVEKAQSSYLIDYDTGTVLYERNPDKKLPIASMVKIMTLVIAFDNLDKGNIALDQMVTVSERAAGMGGSQMFLDAHKDYSISDLIKGIVICSANDASVAIAETISGTKEDFVELMNTTAKKLGMENTVFANVTGLPQEGQYSTARDVTMMMRELLKHKEYYNYSKIYMEDYHHPDGRLTELVNTNKLVRFYKGCDAGKTGFTNASMFCLSASAMRDGTRVIATVVHSPTSKARFAEVSSLFNYAFANYKQNKIVDSEKAIENDVEVLRGKDKTIEIKPEKNIFVLEKKGEKAKFNLEVNLPNTVKAPIKQGEVVGEIVVYNESGEVYAKVNLVSSQKVENMTYRDGLRDIFDRWFTGKKKAA